MRSHVRLRAADAGDVPGNIPVVAPPRGVTVLSALQNVNPGLSRRFAIEDAFRFEDFTDSELLEILNLKLQDQDLDATPEAKAVAIDMLSRARDRPNFGNGGEVENMLGKAKNNHQSHQSKLPASQQSVDVVFKPADFDPNFNRAESSDTNLKKLFEDMVGCEKIVEKLQEYQNIARVAKQRGWEAREARHLIPTNFVFKGPPGEYLHVLSGFPIFIPSRYW